MVAVQHAEDVELLGVGPPAAQRVVGADRPFGLGHLLVARPGEALVDRELGAALGREQQVEERVGTGRGEGRQVAATERDLPEVGVDVLDRDDVGQEGADRGELAA